MKKSEALAIQMRYEGKRTEDIAAAISAAPGTIANWFYAGGKLYKSYLEYEEQQNTLQRELATKLREDAILLMQQSVKRAVEALVSSLESKDERIQLAASRELLNRVIGKPVEQQKIQIEGGQAKIDRWLKEMGMDAEHISEEHFQDVDI